MLRNQLYYRIKPLLPWSVRMSVRRCFAQLKRQRVNATWPIMPGSEKPPQNWPGWPNGKKFALVLTHDVETQAGVDKCRQVMKLEQGLGFRSSFSFVPEGGYSTPHKLRDELTGNGFEVGVHDLRHDGKLYWSRQEFSQNAARINYYLKEWGADGFRSGFMLHNLEWLQDLHVNYDSSTFDTDPFEPQPDGVGTIFPFWVNRANRSKSALCMPHSPPNGSSNGYVELPYTLPQDSTLFLLFRERTPDIWLQKLDWIVKHGGMALLVTHPDYMSFNCADKRSDTYQIGHYEAFLNYVLTKYRDQYWLALPRQVAALCQPTHRGTPLSSGTNMPSGILQGANGTHCSH
jgi:hypothetical protein